MADTGYQDYSQRTNFGQSLSQAQIDTPLVGSAIKAFNDSEKGDIGAVGADIANFASGASKAIEDPLNALISAGLGFLMDVLTPLKNELQKVTGDSGGLDRGKDAFEEVAKDIEKLATELDDIVKSGFQNWSGEAKDAAARKIDTFVQGVEATAHSADNVASCLQASSMLMEAAYNIVMSIIADCIEWIIITVAAAQAAAPFTLGASEAAAVGATAAEVAGETANAASKVEEATTLVERIAQIFQKIISKMKEVEGAMQDAAQGAGKTVSNNWSEALTSGKGKGLGQYLTEREPNGPSKLVNTTLVDPALENLPKVGGMAVDGKFNHAVQNDSQINNELQG